MHRDSERPRSRGAVFARWSMLALIATSLLATACGGEDEASQADRSSGSADPAATSAGRATDGNPGVPASAAETGAGATREAGVAAPRPGMEGRSRELVDPESAAMVMLYHDLARLDFPFDRVIAEDMRVSMAPAIEKQGQRDAVRAELEAALAAVREVGLVRLTLDANLSDYDPTYGEFTVRALAPSSVVVFDAFREHVELRFANGLAAQVWKVPAEEAQLVRDKIGPFQRASLVVLLRITGVQPAANGGGTIQTEIVDYELRAEPTGERLARVQVAS